MLYNFKFTIYNHGFTMYREDIIAAPTAADADLLYNKNILENLSDEQKFEIGSETGQRVQKRISIKCLGESEDIRITTKEPPLSPELQVISDLVEGMLKAAQSALRNR